MDGPEHLLYSSMISEDSLDIAAHSLGLGSIALGWYGDWDFLPFVFSEAASGTLDVGLVNRGRGLDGESLRVLLLLRRRHLWLVLRLCGGYIVAGQ